MNDPHPLVDAWGIAQRYRDAFGQWRSVSPSARTAIRSAMGKAADKSPAGASFQILKPGQKLRLKQPVTLVLEDGTQVRAEKNLPEDVPIGYHEWITDDGSKSRLLVTPEKCYLPDHLKTWGLAIQLYAMRSRTSWGIGDFNDLHNFSRWAARELHCGFVLANPLCAATPILPQQSSPYYPSTRRFLSPLYLRVEDIPGASDAGVPLAKIAVAGRALNDQRLIDRDAVFQLKLQALEKIWKRTTTETAFEAYCRAQGKPLAQFATFCVLAEYFRSGWTNWPSPFRHPESPAVRRFVREHSRRIRFHQWLQWLLDRQLRRAAKALPVIQDLPVGVDPAGADAWVWQDLLARNVTIGAPPDAYSSGGQNWGMQPFIPQRLRESYYEPFWETIRAALRFGGGLRIDHVMGLFRLYWIPGNVSAKDGTYVYYPADELLSILAIESHRAKALIVGEDLGTVEPAVRHELKRRRVLSYRLLWFEPKPPRKFPRQALAAVTTHDLFTIAGLWNGSDLAEQKKLGLNANPDDARKILTKLRRRLRLPAEAGASAAIVKTHRLLAKAPSMLLTATLDDALAVAERPNLPGTVTERPNWSLALPVPLESIKKSPLLRKISRICHRK